MDFVLHWIQSMLQQFSGSWQGVLILFGLSGLLGITHTFGPGHGKSLLLGVLVAESRDVLHALKMALVIGVTHMADVIVLSAVSIFLVSVVPIGAYTQVISVVSGLGILLIGLYRIYGVATDQGDRHNHEKSSHEHLDHDHQMENYTTAFLYSLAPCPGAWVLFMACLGMGEAVVGVILLLGFTVGLLITISALAVSIVYSLDWGAQYLPVGSRQVIRYASGFLVAVLGLWLMLGGQGHTHPGL